MKISHLAFRDVPSMRVFNFQFACREIGIFIGHWPFGMLVIKMSASFIAIAPVPVPVFFFLLYFFFFFLFIVMLCCCTWCCCHCQRSTWVPWKISLHLWHVCCKNLSGLPCNFPISNSTNLTWGRRRWKMANTKGKVEGEIRGEWGEGGYGLVSEQTKTLTEWMQHEEIWQENCKTAGKTKSKSTHIFSNLAMGKAAKQQSSNATTSCWGCCSCDAAAVSVLFMLLRKDRSPKVGVAIFHLPLATNPDSFAPPNVVPWSLTKPKNQSSGNSCPN